MAKPRERKDLRKGLTVDKLDLGEIAPEETNYKIVKALLEANENGTPINFVDFLESVKGFLGEYENLLPRESKNYEVGQARLMHNIRLHTTFTFVAPPKIKDQDRVDWGWEALHALSERVSEITDGDIKIGVEYPYNLRERFCPKQ